MLSIIRRAIDRHVAVAMAGWQAPAGLMLNIRYRFLSVTKVSSARDKVSTVDKPSQGYRRKEK
jgi:hypothetical protein